MTKVAVLGSGSWGTALAFVLADRGYQVFLWGRREATSKTILEAKENAQYLPGVILPQNILPTSNLKTAVVSADLIVLAVPSQAVRGLCQQIKALVSDRAIITNAAKGLETDTLLTLSNVINEELSIHQSNISVLSGPSHAEEVGMRQPTAVVAAAKDIKVAEFVQDAFMTYYFRVYTNSDLTGVEMGGSLKNIIALGIGIADGLGFGDNSKAALITRGLAEISRLGSKLGGDPLTFAGLSGMGDLVVTCTSKHSRNLRAGIALGKGKPLEAVLKEMGMVVEGIKTTVAAHKLAKKQAVEVPIINVIYNILYNKLDPEQGVAELMGRQKKLEV